MPVEAGGIGSPRAGVTGSYEPPDPGAEKRALVPAKAASEPLSHLSSQKQLFFETWFMCRLIHRLKGFTIKWF